QKVRAGFLDLAKHHPKRIKVLSARTSKETVARAVARAVTPMLGHIRRGVDHNRPAASRPSPQKSQARHAIR
ncbi:MAG: dTMP kinase, partial [Nitrospira sp.]